MEKEAREEERGKQSNQRGNQRRRGQPERQTPPLCLCLPLAGLPGSEATEAASPSWHPPGVCTSIAPGAALTINILNFLKMQKPYQPTADQRCFSEVSFCIFLIVCEQVELGCGLNGWWQAGQIRGQRGSRRGCSASPRLVSGLARHPPLPPTLPRDKQPTGPAVDAAWPSRNVCIGSPPVACLVYLFTIGCHRRLGPAGLASKQHDTAKGAGPSKQGQPMVNT